MRKINDFKNKNKTLINDLSAVNAYISKLNISEDLASELFNLAIKRREFRFLFEKPVCVNFVRTKISIK
jgi:hypothetical protein